MPSSHPSPEAAAARVEVDEMRWTDLLQVVQIERKCFRDPWSLNAFVAEFLNRQSRRLVVRAGDPSRVVAYLILWLHGDEAHINNLAVDPDWRRRGCARRLVAEALDRGLEAGAGTAHLEVRPSNRAALRLYRELGFRTAGVRRGYYTRNGEDALVMVRNLGRGAEGGAETGEEEG